MEAIPKDVIEMADDFFSRLSDVETDKMLDKYFKEQKYIAAQCLIWLQTIKDKNRLRNIATLYLVIYRSYKYYGIMLPLISIATFRATYERLNDVYSIHSKNGLSSLETFIEVTKDTHQDDLINHIILKLNGSKDNLVEYKTPEDASTSIAIATILLLLLNNEMKKHIGDEVN